MKIKTIHWNPRFQTRSIDPHAAYKELEKIRKNNAGQLTPRAVVDTAASKRNVLHKAFDWDDSAAAAKYREGQAATLIRSIEVVYEKPDKSQTEPTRALQVEYKGPANSGTTSYAPTAALLERTDTRNQLLLDALRELAAFRRKYALLSELALLIPVVDESIDSLRAAVGAE